MRTFNYNEEGSNPLDRPDIYRLFNNYRVWKYIMGMLIMLNKTQLSEYKILEPGCGGGDKLRFFTELRARPKNCFGIDVSQRAIDLCKSISPGSMNFQVGSVLDMPFEDNMFDIILCSNLFDSFSDDTDIRKISKELRRMIKSDGVLLALDVNEHFLKEYANYKDVMAKELRGFDTTKNELENLLSEEFALFKRAVSIFKSELYMFNGRWADLSDLPIIDRMFDEGSVPCSYSLYSFVPKK